MATQAPYLETGRLFLRPLVPGKMDMSVWDAFHMDEIRAVADHAAHETKGQGLRALLASVRDSLSDISDDRDREIVATTGAVQVRNFLCDQNPTLWQPLLTEQQTLPDGGTALAVRTTIASDVDALFEVTGRADVMAHYVDRVDPNAGWSRERTADFIRRNQEHWDKYGFGCWGIFDKVTAKLIGFCGLQELNWLPEVEPAVELSCYVHPDYWGRGIAPEAVTATLDWSFRLGSIVACVASGNQPSLRLFEKLGVCFEQAVPYRSEVSGREAVFKVHRISHEQWTAIRKKHLRYYVRSMKESPEIDLTEAASEPEV